MKLHFLIMKLHFLIMKLHFLILLLMTTWFTKDGTSLSPESRLLDRSDFPDGFVFGTATSAFQTEGATSEGGKSPTIWDYFSHTFPERTNMQNADVAVDFYHRYKDDIKLLKELNMDSFRFSISWARLIPSGKVKDGVNKEGLQFYNALIDELLANDIQPSVTLYHWDHPQVLEDEYGGFLSPQIIEDFRNFAKVCFESFGDRVKMWTTINEPSVISLAGYDAGNKAVGRCSKWVNSKCQAGDSATEPYIVSHHLLLSHAAAVQEFRKCNKTSKGGKIGIVISPPWFEPDDYSSPADKHAVERSLAVEIDWHLDPVMYGDYPKIMKKYVGSRLPSFTTEQSKMLRNSSDFIGINYYTARFVAHRPHIEPRRPRVRADHQFERKERNLSNHLIGPGEGRVVLYHSYPEGFRRLLNYVKDKYNNPIVYIKENGINDYDDGTKSRDEILNDTFRISYLTDHLQQLHRAIIDDGCDVRGYYTWSLLDNFEWEHGYSARFGLYYVDHKNDLKRYPKDSVNWFKQFLNRPVTKSEEDNEEGWKVSREEENSNKTLDVPVGSETSVDSILNLMTNGSRIEEEGGDLCAFEKPTDQFGVLLGRQSFFGAIENLL